MIIRPIVDIMTGYVVVESRLVGIVDEDDVTHYSSEVGNGVLI